MRGWVVHLALMGSLLLSVPPAMPAADGFELKLKAGSFDPLVETPRLPWRRLLRGVSTPRP